LRARIDLRPLRFDDSLVESLGGAHTLYNTFWVRFERGGVTFDDAVTRSISLFEAARRAGVRRVVHISVAKADAADDLPYFRGKHRVEQWLQTSGLDWAIVRPTLVVGRHDILVNNLAWILRRVPLFLVPQPADCLVQPVSLRDTARIAVEAVSGTIEDAAGPETFTFRRFVELIAAAVESRTRLVEAPRWLATAALQIGNVGVRDVVVTRDELIALGRSLLASDEEPLGEHRFTDWLTENATTVGRHYESELARNFRGQE